MSSKLSIGVRDLKNKATQILRAVREKGKTYTVTLDGIPIALLSAITRKETPDERKARLKAVLADAAELSVRVSSQWSQPETSAADAVSEQRR